MRAESPPRRSLRGLLRRHDHSRDVDKTETEWREQLTGEQFRVLRHHGTERAFTGPALIPDERGMYRCSGCDAPLFRADKRFESGTGWPSFTDSEQEAVETRRDFSMGVPRTEVLCRRCGGHLGHVFNDGPAPGGKRYCINACTLTGHGGADQRP